MEPADLTQLLDEAVAAQRVLTPETVEDVWEPLRRAAEAGDAAVEAGLEMLQDPAPDVRAVGCQLLAECCNGRETPTKRIADAIIALAASESDGDVQWAIANSLGFTGEPEAVPVLVALAAHEDEDVRYQAAVSLPDVAAGRQDDGVVEALIRLTADPCPDVRNWATFGLGRKLDDDSSRIRDALWARTTDQEHDVREEAACGLARRRDPRALPLIQEFLREDDPHVWVFAAAEALGDMSLLPLLEPFGTEGLERTLAACDPLQRATRLLAAWRFLNLLQEAFDQNHPGRVATLFSERLDTGLILSTGDEDGTIWFASAILDTVADDPEAAVAWVLGHLAAEDRTPPAEDEK